MKKTNYASFLSGKLAKGCTQCVNGEKLVLFVTGICPRNCFFCPISDDKNAHDDVYANEWKIEKSQDVIEEAKLIGAKGAGITGGDPLARLNRTIFYIRKLKKQFGKEFHIHMYTSLDLVDKIKLKKLYSAGLDEIRFHPDIINDKFWNRMKLAFEFDWDIGVEIPTLPGKINETKKLINLIDNLNEQSKENVISFLNLNELEIPDNDFNKIKEHGYKTKSSLSYAAKGASEMGIKLIDYVEQKGSKLNVHFCTCTLKDKYQLGNRLKRRAENVAKIFDDIDEEGMLIHGVIYLEDMKPGLQYRQKLKRMHKTTRQKLLVKLRKCVKDMDLKKDEYFLDKKKYRIVTFGEAVLEGADFVKEMGYVPAIVKEYPTYDGLEVEIDFL